MPKCSPYRLLALLFLGMTLFFCFNARAEIYCKGGCPTVDRGATGNAGNPGEDEDRSRSGTVSDENKCDQISNRGYANHGCKAVNLPKRIEAYNNCKYVSAVNGKVLFVPGGSKLEWDKFVAWAATHTAEIATHDCTRGNWSEYGACSTTCGSGGIKVRTCTNPPPQWLGDNCVDSATASCDDFSGCTCSAVQPHASYCPGQNIAFSHLPPTSTYVNNGSCNLSTKCQAQCDATYHAVDGTSCSLNYCSGAPTNGNLCPGVQQTDILTNNQGPTLAASCDGSTKCQAKCGSYYHVNGSSCDLNVCAAAPTVNSSLCGGAQQINVPTNGQASILANSCDGSTICQSACDGGYIKVGSSCLQNCVGATPCGSPGACYAKSGCDDQCGSVKTVDVCGVCGGGTPNNTCSAAAPSCENLTTTGVWACGGACSKTYAGTCCSCAGKICGQDNGCGTPCTVQTCGTNQTCSSGSCICVPNCSGKYCGSDGCGGVCDRCTVYLPGSRCNTSTSNCVCPAGQSPHGPSPSPSTYYCAPNACPAGCDTNCNANYALGSVCDLSSGCSCQCPDGTVYENGGTLGGACEPASGVWVQNNLDFRRGCAVACAAVGKVSAVNARGFMCGSSEDPAPFYGGHFEVPFTIRGTRASFCYRNGQEMDGDRTDKTNACFCK